MDNHIVPECYIDTMMVKVLVPPKKRWNHQHGCYNVCKELETGKLKDKFGVGIIDNDKGKKQPEYLRQFELIVDFLDNDEVGLSLYKHRKRHQYIIQIYPEIEVFIFQVCKEEQIKLDDDYLKLPDEIEEFCRLSKGQSSEHDQRFIKLFQKFKRTENQKLKKLISWLKLLVEKNYSVDINELKNA